MISKRRLEELRKLFWGETSEEWTWEWRDDLTAEEAAQVDEGDRNFYICMTRLLERIVELKEEY